MAKRNNYKHLGPALVSFTLILSVIGMIFETVAILFGYDATMHVFKLGSKVATASVAALFILSIAMITIAICIGKIGKMKTKAHDSALAEMVSSVGGFALASSSVLFLLETVKAQRAGAKESIEALLLFSVILVVASVPMTINFFIGAGKSGKLATALAFLPPIWNAACLIRLYFDAETAINDPVRILLQITLVSVMLALLYELKLRVKGTGKIMFTITASLSTLLASASFMSIMLLYAIVKVGSAADMLLSTGTLLISLYLLMRLSAYYKVRE